MEKKSLITLLYETALEKYKNKKFTLDDIWPIFVKKNKLSEDEQNKAEIYIDMLQDKRFIFLNNNEWKIKEFLSQKEIDSIESLAPTAKIDDVERNDSEMSTEQFHEEEDYEDFKDAASSDEDSEESDDEQEDDLQNDESLYDELNSRE